MPRLSKRYPKYRKHKASGQAIVTLGGRDFYLGPIDSRASWVHYDRLIAEWLANGRRLSQDADFDCGQMSVTGLCVRYFKHAQGYYQKNGQVTNEVAMIHCAIRPVRQLYGDTAAVEFGPKSSKPCANR